MRLKNILASLFILILSYGFCYSQDSLGIKTRKIFNNYLEEQSPGFSIAVVKDGKTVIQENFGYANLEEKTPVSASTKFNLGSLSQQFTATGILILKDQGKLDYKDKVSSYIDGIPDYAKEITIDELLRDVSGLPYLNITEGRKDISVTEEVVDFLNRHEKLAFKTGSKAANNPANYALLTLIIEKVSGENYRDFVTTRIFEPLNMSDSEVYKGGWFYKIKNKARGYQNVGTPSESEYEEVEEKMSKEYLRGVTGIYSTLEDMKKWMASWDSEKLLKSKTLSHAKRLNFIRGAKEFYGYGWRKAFNKGRKFLYQGGIGYGNTHVVLNLPSENIDVIVLSNQRAVFGLRKRAFRLVNLVADKNYEVK
jgi:CubicO group peptidase (beta-lactamase class C family)